MDSIVFIDAEISYTTNKINDLGAVKPNNDKFHSSSIISFKKFIDNCEYICGHNIIHFDFEHLKKDITFNRNIKLIDTLYLSPLLYPKNPYHKLVKDDKIYSGEKNNPLVDSIKAKDLFYDEVNAFKTLPIEIQNIYYSLLHNLPEFSGFFKFLEYKNSIDVNDKYIKNIFRNYICDNSDLKYFISKYPIELAYALAIIDANKQENKSLTPLWVVNKYPKVEYVIKQLCGTPCSDGCEYCKQNLNSKLQLKTFFNFDDFRTYEGEPLQEEACNAALNDQSIITIFPTGGGKSLTFQLPALIAGKTYKGLTVVISPLQSLMKDQIDNLEKKNIVEAVTINGSLTPLERKNAIERIRSGSASLLYISPEQLRSRSIEHLLLYRNVVRFVIDEAHCFSAWGQDFRVDYLYIGDFIKKLQEKKGNNKPICVSCFTATAKQQVITDIKNYFKEKLNINLVLYTTIAIRKNLHYNVILKNDESEKYKELRSLIEANDCTTIIYVQSVRKTRELAQKLVDDGYPALPYNGQMESKERTENQNKFMSGKIKIMVATSAFGMGVDKQDIQLVVHYEVSSSLEDYMQESGRAARDENLQANCYILFSPDDTDNHFGMLNSQKLTINEIQQVWKAIKYLTKNNPSCCRSCLEIARTAGWDETTDVDIKVKTALLALEQAKYIRREENVPKVFATAINAHSTIEAIEKIKNSKLFDPEQIEIARRIIAKLISSKNTYKMKGEDAESRVDWIADLLGIQKSKIIEIINLMRQINLLSDDQDITATINPASELNIKKYSNLETYLANNILNEDKDIISLKEINKDIQEKGIASDIQKLKNIFNFWKLSSYIETEHFFSDIKMDIKLKKSKEEILKLIEKKFILCKFIIRYLLSIDKRQNDNNNDKKTVVFSTIAILRFYQKEQEFFKEQFSIKDIEQALFYLHKINVLSLEGGFLVSYTSMKVVRLEQMNIRYKKEDYRFLEEYYKRKAEQIHIIDKLIKIIVSSYEKAMQFIKDYFSLEYKQFLKKYFNSSEDNISINMTKERYNKIFANLSDIQRKIINDKSQYIVVGAGPGSGKTKILVHKMASLLTSEDIKPEQLLMLTLSKTAAIEFKKRLIDLIGKSAYFVEIKTFHSYSFDLIGHPGSREDSDKIIEKAVELIKNEEFEPKKLTKTVLVLDEAQDMSKAEFDLVQELINYNENMRVIAVGDDDQNIYAFRDSDSKYFQELLKYENSIKYEMVENYRSCKNIVNISNKFVQQISCRMKKSLCTTHKSDGTVNIIKCNTKNMEIPLVDKLIQNNLSGTTCIITKSNEDTLKILNLLNNKNISAKLIQSLDSFKLTNLYEIRSFMDFIKKHDNPIIISNELWKSAIEYLKTNFKTSTLLQTILKGLKDFEYINETKYLSDLETFFNESKLEDFYETDNKTITISTIHKAKGREYNNVYFMIKDFVNTDESKRELYVAMTRAKDSLNVFYNQDIFDQFREIKGVQYSHNINEYPESEEIILQTSLKDVFLDSFKNKKDFILHLRSGWQINVKDNALYFRDKKIGLFSKKFKEDLNKYYEKKYKIIKATIQFIVYWKGDEEDTEFPIILPELKLKKISR